jgi:hypothetical protein
VEDQIFGYLVIAAFGLLLSVSLGIGYLTVVEWRDRQRRDKEAKETRGPRPSFNRKPSTPDKKQDKKAEQKQKGQKQKSS